MQVFLFFFVFLFGCVHTKCGILILSVLAETVKTGDKNRGVNILQNMTVHELYHLKVLIILEQVNASVVKKRRILLSKTGRLTDQVL